MIDECVPICINHARCNCCVCPGGLDAAGQGLSDLQLREQEMPHPKLNKLVSVVDTWKNNRKQPREKVSIFLDILTDLLLIL